ncbi:MAG: sigma 54-interacting transcriptional regulator [Deltaproteobacteria bacterium]|nr:sigma 54-interacting transcriptional regulator [Deltaproteobacteria bacterium]
MSDRPFTRVLNFNSMDAVLHTQSLILAFQNEHITITGFPFSLGSNPLNDFVLQDNYASRLHCRIVQHMDSYFLEDRESTNGTFLNGRRIQKEKLLNHNIIKIGQTEMQVSIHNHAENMGQLTQNPFHGILTQSQSMFSVFKLIQKFSRLFEPVLILGESGTGKELVARALHEESKLPGEFIAINCGAIPQELFESELFGHAKGSFTGAHKTKRGAFELANQGTLFLDEIAELPLDQQTKLLRVLETGMITPVGSEQQVKISVRVVCATHQDLRKKVEKEKFREDLYYRIYVLPLFLPALRERKKDIEPLAQYFAKLRGKSIERQVLESLQSQDWPGNIRELKNTVFRLAALAESETIHWSALLSELQTTGSFGTHFKDIEKRYIEDLLKKEHGNKKNAATHLGISRGTLYRKMKKYALDL